MPTSEGDEVHCTQCGRDNRADSRFCSGCGVELLLACPSCARELATDARFCDGCGAAVGGDAEASAPDESAARKTVTALFCDLVGSTAFGERVDAESVRDAMARYRAMVQSAIEANGGEVAKFIGDGVMALWGVDEVAEDDALRAVQAAGALQDGFAAIESHIRERYGIDVGLRVGVNTGEVVIAEDDDDIVGDALNTAARLEAAATPGRVLVGESTWRLTRHQVEYGEPKEIAAKGKDEPVIAHEAVFDADIVESVTPFVGRVAELARLRQVLEDTILQRAAHMVTVVGSPGVGKTRLAQELRADVEGGVRSFELRCEPSGDATFAPIADLLRAVADLRDGQSPEAIIAALRRVVDGAEDADRTAEMLAGFVGAAPMRSTEEIFLAVRRLFEALGAADPVVLVVDDIQWAEPLFLDLLEHLSEWVQTVPLLLVALARPEIREVRSSFAEHGRRISAVVSLEGLDRETTGELAARLLDTDELPPGLLDRIPESTEGNPLFVREVVRMLVDDGVISNETGRWELIIDLEAVEVPPTVTALLASRVDRMSPDERRILELASVIGSEFPVGALADIHDLPRRDLDAALERMRRKELVEPTGTYLGNEPVFRFHHVLIREAAYRRLLKGARAELHQAVGEWTERAAASLVGEFEVAIATHFEQAHTYHRELDQDDAASAALGRRAAALFEIAASRALEREDLEAAGSLASRALAVLPDTAPEVPALLLVGCEALLSVGRVAEAEPLIERLAEVHDDDARLAAWHRCFGAELAVLTDPGGVAAAEEQVARAAEDLAELDDTAGVAKARWVRALALVRLGKVGECESELDLALTAARAADDHRRVTAVLGAAPMAALWGPSPVPRAGGRCLDVIRLLRITTASPAVEATSVRCQGLLEAMRGRFDTARTMLGTARETVEELGLGHGVAQVDLYMGIAELLAGDPLAAEPALRSAYRGLGTLGIGADAGQAAAYLARALLLQGRLDEAEELVHESDALAGQNQQTAIVVRAVHAEVLSSRSHHDDALRRADEAVALAATSDILFDHANAVASQARVRAAAGDAEGAARSAASAAALYEQKGATVEIDVDRSMAQPPAERPESAEPELAAVVRTANDAWWNRAERVAYDILPYFYCVEDRSDQWFGRIAEDATAADMRPLVGGRAEGRDKFRELFESAIAAPWIEERTETIAVRGDDLVLTRTSGRLEVGVGGFDLLLLNRVDAAGEIDRWIVFDADQLDDAMAELDRLHMETLPLAERLHFETSVAMPMLLGRGDAAAAFRFLHPRDFRMIDNRSLGFPEMEATGYLDRVGMLHELGETMTLIARRVERCTRPAILVQYRTVISSAEGEESHQDSLMLTLNDEAMLVVRQLQFDLEDEAAAIALAEEHTRSHARSPTNLASLVGAQVNGRVLPLHPALSSPSAIAGEAARLAARVVDPSRLDREPHAFGLLDRRAIATRGDELALVAATREDGTVLWSLEEVEAEGCLVDWELFDDPRAAADRLDERFFELDEANREPGAEFLSAFNALDATRTAAVVTADFEAVDHRRMGFGSADAGGWMGVFDALRDSPSVTICQEHVARADVVALNRCIVLYPPASGELSFLSIDVFRDDRLARFELFDVEDEDEAWKRFRELSEVTRPNEPEPWNRADRLGRELVGIVFSPDDRSAEWDERVDGVASIDRDLRSTVGEPWQLRRMSTVAARGDDLALVRVEARHVETSAEREVAVLMRFDEGDRLVSVATFTTGGLGDAVRELDRHHMASLPVAERLLFNITCALPIVIGEGDLASGFRLFRDDGFQMEDRRSLGFPTLDLGEYIERNRVLREMMGDWLLVFRRDVVFDPRAQVLEVRALFNPGKDDESYQDSLIVNKVDHCGLVASQVQFDVDDVVAARAVAAEWVAQSGHLLFNAATVAGGEVNGRLLPPHPGLSSPLELTGEAERLAARVADVDRLDREPHAFGLLDRRVIAIRGDELALVEARRDDEVFWSVEQVDAEGRLVDWDVFDDASAAADGLDERWFDLDEANREPGAEFVSALRAFDTTRMAASITDDFLFVDHRELGFPTADAVAWLELPEALGETPTITIVQEHLARDDNVALNRCIELYPSMSNSESGFVSLDVYRDGRVAHVELFDLGDDAVAWERFHELSEPSGGSTGALRAYEQNTAPPGDFPSTIALRAVVSRRDLTAARDWDAFRETFHPDFRADVFRDLAYVRSGGVDDVIAHMQGTSDVGFDHAVTEVVAIRGELLVLLRLLQRTESGFESEMLRLQEFDPDGRVIYAASYDVDDLVEALRELDRRYTEGWASDDRYRFEKHITRRSLPGPSRESGPVEHRAVLGALADGFVSVDHRELGFGSQDVDGFIERVAAGIDQFGTEFIDVVETVAAFDEHGFVYRAHLVGTTDGSAFEIPFVHLSVMTADGQFVERQERFEHDRVDDALDRLRELTMGRAPVIRNLATEVSRFVNGGVRRNSPPSEMVEFVADGVDLDAKPHGFGVTVRQPIAVRGDRFAVIEFERDGATAWVVEEIDETQRLVEWRVFDDAADALIELDDRYGRTLPLARAFTIGQGIGTRIRPFPEDLEAVDQSPHFGLSLPDYVEVDHRELGFGEQSREEVLSRLRAARGMFGARPNLEVFDTIAIDNPHGSVTRSRLYVELDDGQLTEIPYVAMHLHTADGQFLERTERFEHGELDRARQRLDELSAGRTPPLLNLATAVGRVVNACVRVDSPRLPSFLVGDLDLDAKPHGFGVTVRRPLAIRGDELALFEVEINGVRAWSLEEVDLDGRLVNWELFDRGELAAAVAGLDERFVALDPANWDPGVVFTAGLSAFDRAQIAKAITDDFRFIDRRRVSFGDWERVDFLEGMTALRGVGAASVTFVAERTVRSDTAAVSRVMTVYPDADAHIPSVAVATLRANRMTTLDLFDIEDEDLAWARYRELCEEPEGETAPSAVDPLALANAATRALEAGLGDGEEVDVIAVRGEEHALAEIWSDSGSELRLVTVDESGAVAASESFSTDELAEAMRLLDRWYIDGLGADAPAGIETFAAAVAVMNPPDPEALAALYATDIEVDVPMDIFGPLVPNDPEGFSEYQAVVNAGHDTIVTKTLAVDDHRILVLGFTGARRDAGERWGTQWLVVTGERDGRVQFMGAYDVTDIELARERYEQLGAKRSNRATEAWRLLAEAWERGDTEEAMRHIRDDMTFEIRRRGVQGASGGLDTLIDNAGSWSEVGLQPTFEVLGLLGDRHAVSALTFATDDGAQSVHLVVAAGCDEDGRISSIEIYDDVDLRNAVAVASNRYRDEVPDLPPVIRGWYRMFVARQPFDAFGDDTIVIDHRPGSLMTLSGSDFREMQRVTEVDHPTIATLHEFTHAADRVGLGRTRRWADPGRSGAEWDVLAVVVADLDGVERLELFGEDQAVEARARYDELRQTHDTGPAGDQPTNLAVANQIEHARLSRERRWEDLRAGFHPDFAMVSHRHLGTAGDSDVDALIEVLRSFDETGFAPLDPIPERIVGDRHALLRNRLATSDGQELGMLRVIEVAADGRCLRSANFELEDRAAAEALLERWAADEADARARFAERAQQRRT